LEGPTNACVLPQKDRARRKCEFLNFLAYGRASNAKKMKNCVIAAAHCVATVGSADPGINLNFNFGQNFRLTVDFRFGRG
jgi:hypothetical protein